MNRILRSLFTPIFATGFFYKYRFSAKAAPSLLYSFNRSPSLKPLKKDEQVVVVGFGIAALTVAETLKHFGYSKLTLIGKAESYGGKCVQIGCMPMEFLFRNSNENNVREKIRVFVSNLISLTRSRFAALDYKIIEAVVEKIENKNVVLKNGQRVHFDRLILATGNLLERSPKLGETISVEDFWNLQEKTSLLIVSENQISAIGLAEAALALKHKVTLVFIGTSQLDHLPSVNFAKRELEKRGVSIFKAEKIIERGTGTAYFKLPTKTKKIDFDNIMYLASSKLALPDIDGKKIGIFDIDHRSGTVLNRNDIFVVGDSIGLLSSTESECQGHFLAKSLAQGGYLNWNHLEYLPLRIHGPASLAMVGSHLSWLENDWGTVDFKTLGHGLFTNRESMLWYKFNHHSRMIEAIHIYHPEASELINIAAGLLRFSIDDPIWLTCSVHPSAAEIFKALALKLSKLTLSLNSIQSQSSKILHIPFPNDVNKNKFYLSNFTKEERHLILFSQSPARITCLLFAAKYLYNLANNSAIHLLSLNGNEANLDKDSILDMQELNPFLFRIFNRDTSIMIQFDNH